MKLQRALRTLTAIERLPISCVLPRVNERLCCPAFYQMGGDELLHEKGARNDHRRFSSNGRRSAGLEPVGACLVDQAKGPIMTLRCKRLTPVAARMRNGCISVIW